MEEKQNSTPCHKDAGMHLLVYCLGLVSMQSNEEVGGRLWMQTDLELFVSCVLQSLGKLKHLVSILNCLWHFVIPSVHVPGLFYGGGGWLSKNVGYHGWPTTKNKKNTG